MLSTTTGKIDIVPGGLVDQPQTAGPPVLIIEDNAAQARFCGELLGAIGYDVNFATDGLMGLNMLDRLQPVLILLDLEMPKYDGVGFLQRLSSKLGDRRTPVIVMTSSLSVGVITKVCSLGATDFISKPIDPGTLIEKATKHARIRRPAAA